ncbi:hypothetical protein [Enterococcus sp.]|uniref:hypothetical protein n=1 Tax=Enterococcus sp. TaxID=35783 RepID=UPI00290A80D9|nr:hypothetical protein [Enterococcus sp.]MDU5337157.1 hypothetical protein [Enterococcus sp.]
MIERLKQRIKISRFKNRIYRILLYLSIAVGMFLLYLVFSAVLNKETGKAWFIWFSNFSVIVTSLSISALIMDFTLGVANYLENRYYNFKARNMMESYRSWVINSKYGNSYRILDYLNDNSCLTDLIQDRDGGYRKQQGEKIKMEVYINDLRYKKVFPLYNDVIVELTKKPLYELKNMRSFLEISPKRNWGFLLFKTSFASIISLETLDKVIEVLVEKLKLGSDIELSSLFEYLKVLVLNKGISFAVSMLVIFISLFAWIFLLIYKDTKFDEPHIHEYLKESITRAIEIKENGEETESI